MGVSWVLPGKTASPAHTSLFSPWIRHWSRKTSTEWVDDPGMPSFDLKRIARLLFLGFEKSEEAPSDCDSSSKLKMNAVFVPSCYLYACLWDWRTRRDVERWQNMSNPSDLYRSPSDITSLKGIYRRAGWPPRDLMDESIIEIWDE